MAFEYSCFISYRHNINEALFYNNLRDIIQSEAMLATNKNKLFFDENSIRYGEEWDDKIYDGVSSSFFFIPIYYPNYLHTDNIWCARELMHALRVQEVILSKLTADEKKKFFYIIPFIYRGKPESLPKGIGSKKALLIRDFEYLIIKKEWSPELVKLKQDFCDTLNECWSILDGHSNIDFQQLIQAIPKPTDAEVKAWIKEQKEKQTIIEAEHKPFLVMNEK